MDCVGSSTTEVLVPFMTPQRANSHCVLSFFFSKFVLQDLPETHKKGKLLIKCCCFFCFFSNYTTLLC